MTRTTRKSSYHSRKAKEWHPTLILDPSPAFIKHSLFLPWSSLLQHCYNSFSCTFVTQVDILFLLNFYSGPKHCVTTLCHFRQEWPCSCYSSWLLSSRQRLAPHLRSLHPLFLWSYEIHIWAPGSQMLEMHLGQNGPCSILETKWDFLWWLTSQVRIPFTLFLENLMSLWMISQSMDFKNTHLWGFRY